MLTCRQTLCLFASLFFFVVIFPTDFLYAASMLGGSSSGTGTFRRFDPYSSLKRFRFYGLIELLYRDYTTEASYGGHSSKSDWNAFEQYYRFDVEGYIYHPRLALFSAVVSYSRQDGSDEMNSKSIHYSLFSTFFPARPISLQFYGSRTGTTMDSSSFAANDITSNSYGAFLIFQHKKYPLVMLQYEHWDTTVEKTVTKRVISEDSDDFLDFEDYDDMFDGSDEEIPYVMKKKRVKDKTTVDRYRLDSKGELKFIKTRYFLSAALTDYESELVQYTGKEIMTSTYSTIKNNILATRFQYTDLQFYDLLLFSADLTVAPIHKFYQSYGYEFTSSETPEQQDAHLVRGTWLYRYAARIHGLADFKYKLERRDDFDGDSYDANLNLNYGRPIRAYDFSSSYSFSTGHDELKGEFTYMNHRFMFLLSTRKFKRVRLYTNYELTYRTLDYAPDVDGRLAGSGTTTDIENVVILGATGRTPKRIVWTVELEGRLLNSTDEEDTAWKSVYYGDQPFGRDTMLYTLTGEMGFPVLRRGAVRLKASYTLGTSNSEAVRAYHYESQFRYRFRRNLSLSAWFREEWKNEGWWAGTRNVSRRNVDWKIREYEIICNYLLGRTTFSLEYLVTETEEGPSSLQVSRLMLRATRRI